MSIKLVQRWWVRPLLRGLIVAVKAADMLLRPLAWLGLVRGPVEVETGPLARWIARHGYRLEMK